MDIRGFPTTLTEFQRVFPDDAACAKYLERMRWQDGFACEKCGHVGEPFRFKTISSVVLRCRQCKKNTSLMAGTVMQSSHTPLSTWFWAAYLMTTQTPGQSALQFQRQLGLSRYETAFQILQKLRACMVRPERDQIGGQHPVELDECFIGSKTYGEDGKDNQSMIAGAVEVRFRKEDEDRIAKRYAAHKGGQPLKKLIYAGRLRLRAFENKSGPPLLQFAADSIARGSAVRTDGLPAYKGLPGLGFNHQPSVCTRLPDTQEKTATHLPMIHLVFSNLQAWILGTHHGAIRPHHLQAYLNEYVFRFNRRFYPMTAFNSVLGLAAKSAAPTYKELYSGQWEHPFS